MYAIVKTGGKQYRVEQGQTLLVERLPVDDGGQATLQPLLYVDGENIVDGEGLAKVSIQARVVGHERGPKLRVVKFKPKRGYKRRTGHRQELTRIEVTEIKLGERRASSRRSPKPVAASEAAAVASEAEAVVASEAQAGSGEAEATAPTATATPQPEAKPKATRSRAKKPPADDADKTPAGGEGEPAKPARPRRKRAASKPEAEESNGA